MAKTKTTTPRTKNKDLKIVKEEPVPEKRARKKAAPPTTHTKGVNVLEAIVHIGVSEGPDKGMLRSEGMGKFNFPELMIPAGMPLYLFPVGVSILNELADMMINNTTGKHFAAGHRVQIGPFMFRLKARVYQDKMYWVLSDEDLEGACGLCGDHHGPKGHAG